MIARFFFIFYAALIAIAPLHAADLGTNGNSGLRVGTFDIDATPPIGSMMVYDPMTKPSGPRIARAGHRPAWGR